MYKLTRIKDYGPAFSDYFEQQNAAITAGSVAGQNVKLVALGVNDGWFDALIQEPAYAEYLNDNPYRQIINDNTRDQYLNNFNKQCAPALRTCRSTGSDKDCINSDNVCYSRIEGPLSNAGDFDVYDIRAPSADPNPPKTYATYLASESVKKAIGAQSNYQECADDPFKAFASTGDSKRSYWYTFLRKACQLKQIPDSRGFIPALSDVVKSGVTTIVVSLLPHFPISFGIDSTSPTHTLTPKPPNPVGRRRRLDLQLDRKPSGRRGRDVSRPSRVQSEGADKLHRQRGRWRNVQDSGQFQLPEGLWRRPRSPFLYARVGAPGVQADDAKAVDFFYVGGRSWMEYVDVFFFFWYAFMMCYFHM